VAFIVQEAIMRTFILEVVERIIKAANKALRCKAAGELGRLRPDIVKMIGQTLFFGLCHYENGNHP